jgi:hypothetical protein
LQDSLETIFGEEYTILDWEERKWIFKQWWLKPKNYKLK